MKKLFYLLASGVLLFSCTSQNSNSYTINGTIEGAGDEYVYISEVQGGKLVPVDSAKMESGAFTINGETEMAKMVYFSIGQNRPIAFYIDAAEMNFSSYADSLFAYTLEGSATNDKQKEFEEYMDVYNVQVQELSQRYRAANQEQNKELMDEIRAEYEGISKKMNESQLQWIKENTNSVVALDLLQRSSYEIEDPEEIDAILNLFDASFADYEVFKTLKAKVETMRKTAIGQPAMDFTQNDPDGNPISLSSFKGKVVLVDFWASWCGPCRQENPNVVANFNEFKDKGFTVLGVSLDSDKEKWMKAIEDDQLTWTHVSDLKYWDNEVSQMYGIQAIPANLLLDKEGKIIAKDLRGEKLGEKLTEILGN